MLELSCSILAVIICFCLYLYLTKKKPNKSKFKKVQDFPSIDKDVIAEVTAKLSKRQLLGSPRQRL